MGVPRDNSRILYLFPDTNLFIQCRPIAELPWSDLGDFDEIRLVVCRSVMREIDNQKNRGNDRVGQRARITYKLFRDIIASDLNYQVVNKGKPVVKIHLEASLLPSPELKDHLDYNKPDDEIIGCLHSFQHDNENKDVQLLTHDGGLMMTAKFVGLSFVPIDDNWLLAPENSQSKRELARLRNRVAQLEGVEPQVHLKCVDERGEELECLRIEYLVYSRLAEDDIAALLQLLKDRFPPAEDFGSRGRDVRQAPGVVPKALGAMQKYAPASDEVIGKYLDEDYPKWIKECENMFVTLHETLQEESRQLVLLFVASNVGTRPAKDVLLEIEAKGAVEVCVPFEDDEKETVTSLRLPSPPRPPRGRRRSAPSSLSFLGANARSIAIGPLDRRRDPNMFYYKPSRPRDPVESFSLECKQWRHGTGDEYFDVQVSADLSEDNIEGVVECSIHAENLSSPLRLVIPVRIAIKRVSARNHAERLIGDL